MKKIWSGLIGAAVVATGFVAVTFTSSAAVATPVSQTATMEKSYVEYNKVAFDKAVAKKRVLFFAASWCPTCRSADKDFNANLKSIPDSVVIFKTDYDTELDLKKTYGITHQHTFVYVDKSGKALKTWSGGATAEILVNTK